MTTIAYNHKDKEIAVDGRVTHGDTIQNDSATKTFRRDASTVFFMTGAACDWEDFVNEFCNGKKSSRWLDCSGVMSVDDNAHCVGFDRESETFFSSQLYGNYATGSGGDFALAAMDLGKTAREAVEYAATRNCKTGGLVTVTKL